MSARKKRPRRNSARCWAEREKIAAEEPSNSDYQADLAAAHQQLGQFLANDARIEEGVKETQQAVALFGAIRRRES